MTKTEAYRVALNLLSLTEWEAYLLAESGLPGPRGNLELAQAVAEIAAEPGEARTARLAQLGRWRELTPAQAPVNSPQEYLVFCGVLVLGWDLTDADGARDVDKKSAALRTLMAFAADPRWRTREAVAMALQHWGAADPAGLLAEMAAWAGAGPFVQRAVVAALCEPAVLAPLGREQAPNTVQAQIFAILDRITESFAATPTPERRGEGFIALKKGLAYGWSVAMAYLPQTGRPRLESWFSTVDPDLRRVLRENLSKARLERLDPVWTAYWKERV
jgi:hypothetical protein